MPLEAGWWVALTLAPDSAPLRAYVGEVQEVDEHGVRITLIDWLLGTATSWDFFTPWSSLRSMLVATDQHEVSLFGDEASQWQRAMNTDKVAALLDVIGDEIDKTEDETEKSRLAALREALSNVGQSVASTVLTHYVERVTGLTAG